MTRHEPSDEAILAARLQRAYPSLSPYSSASLAQQLCAIERMQRRHAERCCSGADGGYVRTEWRANCDGHQATTTVHDPDAEERAGKRIHAALVKWHVHLLDFAGNLSGCMYHVDTIAEPLCMQAGDIGVVLHGDPRGAVLKVRLPGEAEAVSV